MTLLDQIIVTNLDGTSRYYEGADYEIDYNNDKIRRVSGGSISDGADIRIFYGKEILSSIINDLASNDSILLPSVKARVMKLTSHDQDPETGVDITDDIISCRIELPVSEPGKFVLKFGNTSSYSDFDPSDSVPLALSIGIQSGGTYLLQPVMLGIVEQRRIIESGGIHSLEISGRDICALLDFPTASASALEFNPVYKRQVFLNGLLISEDWRDEGLPSGEALTLGDLVEIAYRRDFPMSHDAIYAILNEAGWDTSKVAIDMVNYPIAGFDARGKSPLDALTELASRAGASVRAANDSIVIGTPSLVDDVTTSWTYPEEVILSIDEKERDENEYNAVQIFGHSETGLAPTRANLLPSIDPSMPGYVKLFEKEDSLVPEEPLRTDDPPQPFELVIRVPAGTFDPYTLLVSGAKLKENPVRDGNEYEITLLVDWVYDDTAGEAPYIVDENGDRLFFMRGVVHDAVPIQQTEFLPIPHAKVSRERVDVPDTPVEQTSDDSGRYHFENVPKGVYKLTASHPDYLDNYEDNDPANDIERDLAVEEQEYDDAVENGRYLKRETSFHVILWAKPSTEAWGLSEHVVDQVMLEVRDSSVQSGGELKYAPVVRDENITTATLAVEIGRNIISISKSARHPRVIEVPANPYLSPSDAIRISGGEIDQTGDGDKLVSDRVIHEIDLTDGRCITEIHSGEFDPSVMVRRHLKNDPLDRMNGVVTGLMRDSQGIERCDVAADGSIYRGLARSPAVPQLHVRDSVLISKPSRGASQYLVVARTSDIFGPENIVYV